VTFDRAAGFDPVPGSGSEALRRVAPEVGTALTGIEAAAWGGMGQDGRVDLGILIDEAGDLVFGLILD